MKKLTSVVVVMLITAFLTSSADAKRKAPKKVAPVTRNGVTYTAPHFASEIDDPKCKQNGGWVVAKDAKSGKVFWKKEIYAVKRDPALEGDVQDCFITKLSFEKGKLIVTNERGHRYELDPDTRAVRLLKGT